MVQGDNLNMSDKKDLIDFSINYSPFRISDKVFKNIKINSKIVSAYPSPYGERIIKYLTPIFRYKKENVIICNGSTEAFFLIPQTFRFNRVLLFLPSFWEYEFTISLNKIKKDFLKLSSINNFKLDIKEFENRLKKVDCVYICNPNNPTSTYIEKDILISLIKKNKSKMFVIDETYLLFFKDYNSKTLSHFATKYNNLIVVSSLSKIFGIGGLRMGFCVSSKKNINLLNKIRNPYSINILSELVLPKILKLQSYLKKIREFVLREKMRMYGNLKKIKWLKPFKPEANFILVKIIDKKVTLSKIADYLRTHKIKIRRGEVIKGLSDRYFRVCVKTREENNLLIKALNKFK